MTNELVKIVRTLVADLYPEHHPDKQNLLDRLKKLLEQETPKVVAPKENVPHAKQ